MKKWLFAFVADLYLMQIFIVLTFIYMPKPITMDYKIPVLAYFLFAFLLLSFILFVANIICAVKMQTMQQDIVRKRNVFGILSVFKLTLIPFFIVNFILWLFFIIGSFNPFMMILWIFIPCGIVYTYMILLGTSAYTISQIFILRRNGILTKKESFFHVAMQLLFIIDVIDCLQLRSKDK